jgi:acylphosphatase
MLKQCHLYIKGDVIGVGFRAWTKIQAKITGVTGWVRNNSEGFVEATVQGDEDKIKQMIEAVRRGPPVSRVDDVEVIWQDPKEVFEEFSIVK